MVLIKHVNIPVKNKMYGDNNIIHVSVNIEFIKLLMLFVTVKLQAINCCKVVAIYNLYTLELGWLIKLFNIPRVLLMV